MLGVTRAHQSTHQHHQGSPGGHQSPHHQGSPECTGIHLTRGHQNPSGPTRAPEPTPLALAPPRPSTAMALASPPALPTSNGEAVSTALDDHGGMTGAGQLEAANSRRVIARLRARFGLRLDNGEAVNMALHEGWLEEGALPTSAPVHQSTSAVERSPPTSALLPSASVHQSIGAPVRQRVEPVHQLPAHQRMLRPPVH